MEATSRVTALGLLMLTSCFPIVVPLSLNYPAYFNFGDSNSDTGGLVAGVGFPLPLPYGETFFGEPSGRFSDGRLVLDFLMNASGLPFLNPYLDSVGAPSFREGSNFAAAGATILPAPADSTCPFSLGIQVSQFLLFKSKAVECLTRQDCKWKNSLPLEDYFKQGLYMLDIGQNDLDGAFYNHSESEVLDSIPTILSEFETQFQRLFSEGARNFWIHNTGPLGCLPRIIADFRGKTTTDSLGCSISHNQAAIAFNAKLLDLHSKLLVEFPGANITYVDIFSIKLKLICNFATYGFKQNIEACCGYGGPPLNFDNRIGCGQTKDLNRTIATAGACNNTAEYVDWDGNHYTEAANNFIAEQILSGNYFKFPTPP